MRNPIQHTETFKVRHYECDAFGSLNNAVYLRYMQEAGIEASNALGFDDEKYKSLNRTWLPRLTEIEFLQPIGPSDKIELLTWVHSARRVQSRRIYEFRKWGEKKLCAKAHTDWVFIERDKGISARIPADLMKKFLPLGIGIPRQKFPNVPANPQTIFKVKRSVEWRDIDPMQHLNNAAYVDYAEQCNTQVSKVYGLKWIEMNMTFVARRTLIEYLIPAGIDVELQISTWLFDLEPTSISRFYTFQNAGTGELLARMITAYVSIDLESGSVSSIPSPIIEALSPNISKM